MELQIRTAEIRDVDALREIDLLSFVENRTFDPHIDPNWIYGEKAIHYFSRAIQDSSRAVFVAISDGVPVGFVSVVPKVVDYRDARIAEIDNLAVIPSYRSKGIGSALLLETKRWAKRSNFTILYVSSYAKNSVALALYNKAEFKQIDVGLELELK